MNYTITNGKTINGTPFTHFLVITDSNGVERNIHKDLIASVNLNSTTVTLQGESPLWLIDFSKDDIITFNGNVLIGVIPASRASELRDLLLSITASSANNIVNPVYAVQMNTASIDQRLGPVNEVMAIDPNAISGLNGLLRLIAERCGVVINNTGDIALYTDTLEQRVGNITESLATDYNASSGLNGLLRLMIKTLVDDFTTLNAKDFATQTTLAAAKTVLDSISSAFTTLNGKDFATQTTLAAVKTVLDTISSAFTTLNATTNPIEKYHISDEESGGTIEYYGKVANNGAWFILKIDTVAKTYRYANGSSNYTTAWTGRAGLTYQYYYQITL
jgi:hypothetical protein